MWGEIYLQEYAECEGVRACEREGKVSDERADVEERDEVSLGSSDDSNGSALLFNTHQQCFH